jgi:hypothetical protein
MKGDEGDGALFQTPWIWRTKFWLPRAVARCVAEADGDRSDIGV